MIMDNWLVILGVGFLVLILVFPFLPIGTRPRCPECGGRKIGVQKTATGFRTSDFGGGRGGGGSRVQMQYDVKYQCNDCQTKWTATITETQ
jgi:hypothetical protein